MIIEKFNKTKKIISDENSKLAVYLFINENKICKIGITDNILQRLKSITTASGIKTYNLITLEIEHGIDEDTKFIEKFLHNYFFEKRLKGEFFKLNLKDILQIKKLFWNIYGAYIHDDIKETLNYLKTKK